MIHFLFNKMRDRAAALIIAFRCGIALAIVIADHEFTFFEPSSGDDSRF